MAIASVVKIICRKHEKSVVSHPTALNHWVKIALAGATHTKLTSQNFKRIFNRVKRQAALGHMCKTMGTNLSKNLRLSPEYALFWFPKLDFLAIKSHTTTCGDMEDALLALRCLR